MNLKETIILEYLKTVNLKADNISMKNIIKELTPKLKETPTIEPVWEDISMVNEDSKQTYKKEVLKSISIWYTDTEDNKHIPRKVDIIV